LIDYSWKVVNDWVRGEGVDWSRGLKVGDQRKSSLRGERRSPDIERSGVGRKKGPRLEKYKGRSIREKSSMESIRRPGDVTLLRKGKDIVELATREKKRE